jgi:hypothetical protein
MEDGIPEQRRTSSQVRHGAFRSVCNYEVFPCIISGHNLRNVEYVKLEWPDN